MATKKFTYLPRFADNESKQKNIVDFIASMNVGKKNDKINDFGDFFLFNNLYNSCAEIMRNEDTLADRNIKSTVHTIVSSSKISSDLAYIAENVDGVIESMREQSSKLGNEGKFDEMSAVAKAWEKMSKDIEVQSKKLKDLIDSNLQKGYGSRYQLKKLEKQKFEANKDKIEELLSSEKSASEIASELDIKPGFIMNFESELIDNKLNSNIALIKTKIAENVSRADIAEEFKVSRKRLANFITEKKLADVAKPKAKSVPKKKQEAKPKAEKAETKATE